MAKSVAWLVVCVSLVQILAAPEVSGNDAAPSAEKCAAVKPGDRVDCGGQTEAACRAKGCCFSQGNFWFGCYYANVTEEVQEEPLVVLVGWRANGTYSEKIEHLVVLPDASNERKCAKSCHDLGTDKCRLVSFNSNTRKCDGFTGKAIPVITRDISSSLLAYTGKTMRIAAQHLGKVLERADLYAASGKKYSVEVVGHQNVCVSICTVHPLCNAAVYNKSTGECWLKAAGVGYGTLTASADPTNIFVSYFA